MIAHCWKLPSSDPDFNKVESNSSQKSSLNSLKQIPNKISVFVLRTTKIISQQGRETSLFAQLFILIQIYSLSLFTRLFCHLLFVFFFLNGIVAYVSCVPSLSFFVNFFFANESRHQSSPWTCQHFISLYKNCNNNVLRKKCLLSHIQFVSHSMIKFLCLLSMQLTCLFAAFARNKKTGIRRVNFFCRTDYEIGFLGEWMAKFRRKVAVRVWCVNEKYWIK